MAQVTTQQYRHKAAEGIGNPVLQKTLANLQDKFGKGAAQAYRRLPEGPGLRLVAHDIRMESIAYLDILLDRLTATIEQNGGRVFFAHDADAAVGYIRRLAREKAVRRVVKGKSMVSEEIGLNEVLEADGIDVTETDLGEYIVQLAGEQPSHIIAPAAHKTRFDIGRLFQESLGIDYSDDPPTLTWAARKALREKFLSADMGITGCNLACAETGHIAVVSNEGNIRMSSTLPRIHVAVMGMERVIARLEDHDILLRLLTRAAAVQNMATYVNYIGGPRRPPAARTGRWTGGISSGSTGQRALQNPRRYAFQGNTLLHPLCRLSEHLSGIRKNRRPCLRISIFGSGRRRGNPTAGGHQPRPAPVPGRDPVRSL